MPFCRACGEKAPTDSLYCGRCGYALQAPSEGAVGQSNPHTTFISQAPVFLTQPLQNSMKEEEEEEDRPIIPPFIPLEVSANGSVPSVSGTPQVGTVPSLSSGAGTGTGTATSTAATV